MCFTKVGKAGALVGPHGENIKDINEFVSPVEFGKGEKTNEDYSEEIKNKVASLSKIKDNSAGHKALLEL